MPHSRLTVGLLSAIFGYFLLPESLTKEKRAITPFNWSSINPVAAILEMAARPNLGVLLFATFVFNFVYGAMASNFSVYTIEKFGAPPFENASVFTLVGAIGFIIQAGVVQRLVPRFGEKKLALSGLVMQVLGFLGIGVALAFWLLYPISTLIGAGNAFMRPTLSWTCWRSNIRICSSAGQDHKNRIDGGIPHPNTPFGR